MALHGGLSRALILFTMLSAVILGLEQPVLAATPPRSANASADVLARPDAVSALLTAKAEGHRVEITSDDTVTSTTYMNPDGTLTTEQASGPVRVQNADGSWSPLDLDLAQNSDGSWSPAAVPATVDFSGGGDKSVATVADATGRRFGLGWASKLPTPTVTGGTAAYQLNPTTQLVVSSTALGFTTHLVLSAAPSSAPMFKLPLIMKKLAASQTSDGSLVVSDSSNGKAAWRSRPFVMWDSQTDAAGNPTNVAQVSYTLANTNGSGQQELDLSPAMSYLTASSTQYPVTIDPDVASATSIGSTYVYTTAGGSGNTTAEWTDWKLPVSNQGTAGTSTAYVDFDTSPFAGKHVLSATLSLWQYFAPHCTAATLNVYPTTATPTASTVYANRPGYDTTAAYAASGSFNHGYVSGCPAASAPIDVTAMAQAWAAGTIPSDGMALVQNTSGALQVQDFCSMNPSTATGSSCTTASVEPSLSYTYKSYPGVPSALSVLPSTLSGGVYQVSTLTPTLTATPVQPDGGSVTEDFEVDSSSGSTVYSHAVSATAGSPASVQVPSGLLHEGDQLTWKARTDDGTDISAWSAPQSFTIALPPPPTPTASCTAYPQNIFTNRLVQSGDTCTVYDTDPNLTSFSYGFDTSTNLTSVSAGSGQQTISIPTSLANNSWHALFVEAVNPAGASSLFSYNFGIGIQCQADGSCIPGIPTGLSISPGTIDTNGVWQVPSRTPSLTATAMEPNPNGDTVYLIFTVVYTYPNPPYQQIVTWSTVVRATPGTPTTVQIPSGLLSAGSSYTWQASTWDTTQNLASAQSDPQSFLATPPTLSPTVNCVSYPQAAWTNRSIQSGDQCTLIDTDPELAGFFYGFDTPPPTQQVNANPNNQQASITIPSSLATGWHTLYVMAYNDQHVANGNGGLSNLVAYSFGVGVGGLSTPLDGQRTQRSVVISSKSEPSKAMETLNYRIGTSGNWVPIPTGDLTINSTGAHPSGWPLTGGNGAYPDMTWDVAATVTAAGGSDGPLQLEACYTGNNSAGDPDGCSTPTLSVLDRTSFTAALETDPVGPGTLAPATGDFLVGATDVQIAEPYGSLSVGRSLTTLAPATGSSGARGVLGPAWRLQIPGPDFTGASQLTPAGSPAPGFLTLTDEIGTTYTYKGDPTQTTFPATYQGVGDSADGSVLTETSATAATLTDADGTVTDWTQSNGVWQVSDVTQPGKDGVTTYTFDSRGRVSEVIAPAIGLDGCGTSPQPGCRLLDFHYATATTATSDTSSGWGDYANQLSTISYTAYDPATAGMRTTTVAQYAYDTHGLLRAEWDPRISPALKTTYAYDGNNRLVTLTPPGLNPWTMNYDSAGRLASVSRTDPANGTATQAVAYGVPLSGSGAPVDLSPATTATWGESNDLPYGTGTAMFPPDHVPAAGSNGDYAPTSADWPYSTITYRDANGREVNTADYGAGTWLIATSQYDPSGNITFSLSPGNRAQALSPTGDTDPAVAAMTSSAARASALATLSSYTDDGAVDGRGVDLTDTYSPTAPLVLDNGTIADARSHTHYTYDQGEPFYYPALDHLVTTTTTGAYYDDGSGTPTDHDVRTTLTGYNSINNNNEGWDFRSPTTQTIVMPGTHEIETKTSLDVFGNVIESMMPKADGGGADGYTTLTDYYSAASDSTHPDCDNHPEWAGFVCWTGPAVQPDGQTVPTTEVTYNYLGEPAVSTQTSGGATRTSTVTYDGAGRPQSSSINDTTSGVTQVPTVSFGYDPATGLLTTTSTPTQTITTNYDALGRATSYTAPAASGTNTTTENYDIDSRPTSINDGKGATTYGYGSTDSLGRTEHRGLLTGENVGMGSNPSTFAAAYDADGNMISESYPASVVATSHFDDTGNLTSLAYATGGSTLAQFSQASNAFGEIRTQSSPESSQTFTYDPAARLAQTADSGDGTCVTRAYSFDADTNRTGLSTYPASGSGGCSTSTTPIAQSWTHDAADRTTNTGYSYDSMGRTVTLPGADTSLGGNGSLTLSYFANDMVHSENDGTNTESFTLDPAGRIFSNTTSATGLTTTNIYAGPGDSPAWQAMSDGTWSRNVTDIAGNLAVTQGGTAAGTAALQIVNPHGDVVATLTDPTSGTPSMTAYFESTEFGAPRAANTVKPAHYGWLGGKRRDSGDIAGLVLMGRRLYDPYAGRFTSVDPVPGGSANGYDYCAQDPINSVDLNGNSPSPPGPGPAPAPSTNYDWARLLLRDGGWPVTHNNVTVILQWMNSEHSQYSSYPWWNNDNPLDNGYHCGGGSGTGPCRNLVAAAKWTAANLLEGPDYRAIVKDLARSAKPTVTARAIQDSDWASSHYGHGKYWTTGKVYRRRAPASAWGR